MNRWKLSRERALVRLRDLKQGFRSYVDSTYGYRAKDCGTCLTPCCADAEFVNVNVTRLEAEAMIRVLADESRFAPADRERVIARAHEAVETYGLATAEDTFAITYACPLFEPGTGCLVHNEAKPAPCIHHGCYEQPSHLPDDASRIEVEGAVADLNREVYGNDESAWGYRTIPVWVTELARRRSSTVLAVTGEPHPRRDR